MKIHPPETTIFFRYVAWLLAAHFALTISPSSVADVYSSPEEALEHPGYKFQGEFIGEIVINDGTPAFAAGLQVGAMHRNMFRARLHYGGLPGDPAADGQGFDLEGVYAEGVLELSGEGGFRIRHAVDYVDVMDESGVQLGRLERINRQSPTSGMSPPQGATVLFDGSTLNQWRDGASMTENGLLKQGATTRKRFGDMCLHVEAKIGFMPANEDQRRANSGIYIQNRYEVQILDSFGLIPARNGNASLYNVSPPLINASYPPLSWQTYDIFFRAPRFDANGIKTENARVTVYLNGILVQDDIELEIGTGAGGLRGEVPRAELYLQDHTGPVRFRNVWVVEKKYSPPGVPRLQK